MSVIAAHIGSKQVTFLVVDSSGNHEVFRFPFVFSPSLQSHFTNEADFYTDIFKHVQRKFHLPVDDCELFVCSDLRPVEVTLELKVNTTFSSLASGLSDVNFLYINALSAIPVSKISKVEMTTFFSNLSIVPHMVVEKPRYKMYLDSIFSSSLSVLPDLKEKLPVLLFGDKFSSEYDTSAQIYQSALSFIDTLGVFEVSVDTQGLFVPMLLLKKHRADLYKSLSMEVIPEVLGTVIRLDKPAECLFKTDSGTSQFFEVSADSLFFVPLEEGSKAQVTVKSASLGQYEGFVHGGRLGFVIDTRQINKSFYEGRVGEEDLISFENFNKQVEEALTNL